MVTGSGLCFAKALRHEVDLPSEARSQSLDGRNQLPLYGLRPSQAERKVVRRWPGVICVTYKLDGSDGLSGAPTGDDIAGDASYPGFVKPHERMSVM